ncbi:DUF6482 family protein [Aliiglaciecola sp. 3_MG-2023]|uniref:DUF6482 family protein n=1 Tax=Aliiglaciecola sp. 3_MG-2023 TaxID=3062644 RepID=UPI0026E1AE88|nr:DUF6482 family protein [Aliiglaciecola sp. 3_MG-2023]MDO6694324.1 DUF6482 family protein [Aliiglaciecola sp. 3_MG-2023]
MKFEYQQLINQKQIIDELELQSFEMNIYLLKLHVGNNQGMLYENGQLMRFHSTQQVRDAFAEFTVLRSVMVHDSPYDEMIGNPPKTETNLKMPFSMQQPY